MSAVNPLPASGAAADKRPYEPSMEEILASIRRIIADDQTLPGKVLIQEPEAPTSLDQPVAPPDPSPFPAPRDEVAVPPQAPAPQPAPYLEPVARMPEPHVQVQEVKPQDVRPPAPEPEPIREAAQVTELRAHGVIAAPQFATPPRQPVEEPAAPEMRQAPPAPEAPAPAAPPPADFEDDDEALYDEAIEPSPQPLHLGDDLPPRQEETAALFSSATDTAISSAFNMLAASRLADNSDELMNLAREMIRPLLRSWIDDNLPSMVERMVRAEIERVARGGR